ncbi:molecular chaperone [Desulfurivibrio sp. D14AmB]|uniref:TorD/DmsD family molecular chaperone n=1 Tax=Desulfurivibrio sp. D14AmB TaxID=3374370 RepID=UPI00376EE7D1
MNSNDDLNRHDARGRAYQGLSALYHPPAATLEKVLTLLKGGLEGCYPELAPYADDLLAEYREQADLGELRDDYTRLFLGPGPLAAAPYGSFYLDGGRTMGPTTLEAQQHYQVVGLKPGGEFKHPPDFIATELEFMFFLIHCQLQTADPGTASQFMLRQRAFLNRHPGRWVEPFTELVIEEARAEFYKVLGALTQNFILAEQNALPELQAASETNHG